MFTELPTILNSIQTAVQMSPVPRVPKILIVARVVTYVWATVAGVCVVLRVHMIRRAAMGIGVHGS